MMRWILLLALLSGCHDAYSNENILFLKAIPRGLQIDVPDDEDSSARGLRAAQFDGDQAKFRRDAAASAAEINASIEEIFAILDSIVSATDPTAEEDNVRFWGPIPVDETYEIALAITHMTTSTTATFVARGEPVTSDDWYSYLFLVREQGGTDDDWAPFVGGMSVPVEDTPYGAGILYLDLRATSRDPEQGLLLIPYDSRFGERAIDVYADANPVDGADFDPDAAWQYRRRPDGAIDFLLYLRQNVPMTGPALEIYAVATRWDPDGAGRGDAAVTEGDFGAQIFFVSECWDRGFERTYLESNIPELADQRTGAPEDCPAGLESSNFPDG